MTTYGEDTGQGPVASPRTPPPPAPPPRPPASAARPTQFVPSAATTAELPAVGTGTAWYEEDDRPQWRPRRRPAPIGLRFMVVLLAVLVPVAAIGYTVVRLHPTWVDFLRKRPAATAQHTSAPLTTSPSSGGLQRLRSGPQGPVYSVPTDHYSLVLTVASPCWTVVKSPAGSSSALFAKTIQPTDKPAPIAVQGSSSLEADAASISLAVRVDGRTVGTIRAPRVGTVYTFQPATR